MVSYLLNSLIIILFVFLGIANLIYGIKVKQRGFKIVHIFLVLFCVGFSIYFIIYFDSIDLLLIIR
ncbi:Ca2+/Na+ antiporter [Bacillus thermophilus]|uniref:Ca2+/Na+ antiporter n=1 Tax=Siminovitchia thermophila TaxID=1245522 RepID=A0ABS2R7I9_9BACI|nr:Ca2+/Na+ antiporter [Siminovitchia thermophila]